MLLDANPQRWIPHREPFLYLDEVVAYEPLKHARGILRPTGAEDYFRGHFPDRPILPGVLILEHMAQLAAFLMARSRPAPPGDGPRLALAGVDRARFLRAVHPGDELITEVTLLKAFETMALVEAVSRVGEEIAARARLQFGAIG